MTGFLCARCNHGRLCHSDRGCLYGNVGAVRGCSCDEYVETETERLYRTDQRLAESWPLTALAMLKRLRAELHDKTHKSLVPRGTRLEECSFCGEELNRVIAFAERIFGENTTLIFDGVIAE